MDKNETEKKKIKEWGLRNYQQYQFLEIDKEKNIFRQTHFSQNQSRHSLLPGFVLLNKCNYAACGISSLTL